MALLSKRVLQTLPVCLQSLAFLMILIVQLAAPARAQSPPQRSPEAKDILILHSFEGNAPVFFETGKGLSNALQSGGVPPINQYFESLDLRRNPGPDHRKLLVEQMRTRYGHRKPGMIITMYPEALEFVLKDCRDILPEIPILALYLPLGNRLPKTERRIIGHAQELDVHGTVEIALKLVPGVKRVYFVSGDHEIDRRMEDQARRDSRKGEGELEFISLSHLPFEEILAAVSGVTPGSIILVLGFSRDVAGNNYTTPVVVQRLSRVSPVPIFGSLDVTLGHGIAGGSLVRFENVGTEAGKLVLDILRGGPTEENFPKSLNVACVPMFDWRELRRWKLSETALPGGSIVINREFTFWDYRYYIIGGLLLLLVQSLLIAALLLHRRRMRSSEESLRKRTQELDQFFSVSLDLLCIANTEGYFLRLNPAWERILGFTREELMAKPFFEFVHPDDRDRTREALSTLRSQAELFPFQNRYRCRDGTYRWLQWSSASTGKLLYSAARDVTEDKRTQEELLNYRDHLEEMILQRTRELVVARDQAEAANRAKSAFLANMSHELRTPLATILGVGELLERDPVFQQRQGRLLGILSGSGKHLFALIDDVLELSRIDAGQTALSHTPFDLRRFLEDLAGALTSRAERKGLEMALEFDDDLPGNIRTDPHKLRQILLNLLSNGIKFTEKGRVVLRVMRKEGAEALPGAESSPRVQLAFEVEDTGIGIRSEDQERIFEMFVQVDHSRTPSEGVGLGLAISRKLTSLLGGELVVRSEVGRGSLFTLNIGVERVEDTDMPRKAVVRKVTGLAPGNPSRLLLVVDDNLESRLLLRQLLESVGFTVLEADGGRKAVHLCRRDPPDLIWMDIRMPGMDGHEAARRIREEEQVHIPIVAFTAGAMENTESSPLSGLFDDWVYKPFREEVIFEMLEKHLGVEFIYEPIGSMSAREGARKDREALTPADLSILPADWLDPFYRKLKTGQSRELLAMISQIRPAQENVARRLGDLVQAHDFERLIPLFEETLKEKEDE